MMTKETMSTNEPPRKYGYTLPSLGGKGMGQPQEKDLLWIPSKEIWENRLRPEQPFVIEYYYCRPIDPGPEHELVGEDEVLTIDCEYTLDAIHWISVSPSWITARKTNELYNGTKILAIRRRRKVVKDEWPKYWYSGASVYKSYRPHSKGLVFHNNSWVEQSQADKFDEVVAGYGWPQITPQRAFELTGDKSILEKGGDDMQPTTTGSPHPDVVQPSPEISQEKVGASPPQWIPVSEFNLGDTEPFWAAYQDGKVLAWEEGCEGQTRVSLELQGIDHFMPCKGSYQVPPPPQPKTQQEKDEEWIAEQLKNEYPYFSVNEEIAFQKACRVALAYAREEKGEK